MQHGHLLLLLSGGLALLAMNCPNAAQPGEKLWEFPTGGSVQSSPAIAPDGTVYVGSSDGKVYALTGTLGQKVWEFQTGGAVMASPAVGEDGTVYVGSQDGKMYALNGGTGQKIWEFQTSSNFVSAAAIGADGTVYVGTWAGWKQGALCAFDGATGQRRWQFPTGDYVVSYPVISPNGSVLAGGHALDGTTGQRLSDACYEESDQFGLISPAIDADGTAYVVYGVGEWDGWSYGYRCTALACDVATGRRRWAWRDERSTQFAEPPRSPVLGTDGPVYVVSSQGWLYELDGATGRQLRAWPGRDDFGSCSCPALGADGTLYFSRCMSVLALDLSTGQHRWEFPFQMGTFVTSSLALGADGTLCVGASDGKVYAIQGSSGLAQSPWSKFRGNARNTGRATPPVPLRLAIWWHGDKARIEWPTPGVLQATDALVPADWQDLSEAASPYDVEPANARRFYRLRCP